MIYHEGVKMNVNARHPGMVKEQPHPLPYPSNRLDKTSVGDMNVIRSIIAPIKSKQMSQLNKPYESIHPKPLIVLLGWLGCRPRTLSRYIQLYHDLGCQVITRILPPSLVIYSAHYPLESLPPDIHHLLLSQSSISSSELATQSQYHSNEPTNITQMAMGIFQEITLSHYPYYIIHTFSNGGCFLWEKMHQILLSCPDERTSPNDLHKNSVSTLKSKLIGVVFDSGPAAYHSRPYLLDNAMMHIPRWERFQLKLQIIADQWKHGQEYVLDRSMKRSVEYWNNFLKDPLDIPQLYMYSTVDHLTDSLELEKLIHHRRTMLGTNTIQSLPFDKSPHCSHLLYHPSEYKATTASFLEFCISTSRKRQESNEYGPFLSKL